MSDTVTRLIGIALQLSSLEHETTTTITTLCPPYLYTVANLPWEVQKSHFQRYYSYILQIIFVISEKKQTVTPLPTTPEKCHNTTL